MPEHIRQGTLHEQKRNAECHIMSELALIDKTHAKECHQRERKKQQKTINKEPTKAHKQIFASSKQKQLGLLALKDPRTGNITSDPQMVKDIIYDFYKQSLSAVKPKTGKYLPNKAPRQYPWEQMQAPDPFELESHLTRDGKKGTQERPWLHYSIIDQAAFHECIRSLSNDKSPGLHGVVNEVHTMLPPFFSQSISILYTSFLQ